MFNRFSTYRRPINVCLPQSFQLPPQYFMLRERTIWVFIHNSLCHFTDILQQLSVAGYIRYFQIKGDAGFLPNHRDHAVSSPPLLSQNHRLYVP